MDLEVWLNGEVIAVVGEKRGKMSMTYTNRARPLGAPLISMAMPVGSQKYGDKKVRAFFRGLLPEGQARRILAYDFGVAESDDMGLLAALGKDCAGALVLQPKVAAPPLMAGEAKARRISDAEIGRRLRELPVHPLGVDGRTRVSLAGVQSKLLLTQCEDGTWELPVNGAPSTHILKPAHRELPESVVNEAFCLALAERAGVRAARTSVSVFGDIETLVSERFDRVRIAGNVERLHQEDACQALSVLTLVPEQKYEGFGGPSLAKIAELLDLWGGAKSKEELLRQVAFHVIVGNADAHGKNFSFLHNNDRTVCLAPAYDVMSTSYYSIAHGRQMSSELGLFVNQKRDIDEVTVEDLLAEAECWGVRREHGKAVLNELLERLPEALSHVIAQVPNTPQALVELVRMRAQRAREEAAILSLGRTSTSLSLSEQDERRTDGLHLRPSL